jgi:hypothetical protein
VATSPRKARVMRRALVVLAALGALAAAGAWLQERPAEPQLPDAGSAVHEQMVSIFHVALAALDVGEYERAAAELERATVLVPDEPAAWANLGLVQLRRGKLEEAEVHLVRAAAMAPASGAIELLRAQAASASGRFDAAAAHLRRAVELEPSSLKARYALVQELLRVGTPAAEQEAARGLDELLRLAPANLVLLLEDARLAAKHGNGARLQQRVTALGHLSQDWPAVAQEQFLRLEEVSVGSDLRQAAPRVLVLRNVLVRTPVLQEGLAAVQSPPELPGEPLRGFLRLPAPQRAVAEADARLAFELEPVLPGPPSVFTAVAPVWLGREGAPAVFGVGRQAVQRLDSPSAPLLLPGLDGLGLHGLLAVEWDFDFRTDLLLCAPGGIRLLRQLEDGSLAHATVTSLPVAAAAIRCTGAWAADLEADGDLDLVLGVADGVPAVLQNNADGTASIEHPFSGPEGARDFVWADLDGDGDADAAMLGALGDLVLHRNERGGRFVDWAAPEDLGPLAAIAAAGPGRDGRLGLTAVHEDGRLLHVAWGPDAWSVAELGRGPAPGVVRLQVEDMDNNGAPDLIVTGPAGTRIWLAGPSPELLPIELPELRSALAADLTGDGRLELLGLSAEGVALRAVSSGSKAYHWQALRPRAQDVAGDQRINPFGIGSVVELRAGLLYQRRTVTAPVVHFGLGTWARADVVRVQWPNGTLQAEFDLEPDSTLVAEQRLKGSCPWLFAWDGSEMRFVKDFLWRSPLGLRINAQQTAGVAQTEDRVKLSGRSLAPRDGRYELRITAELWETHYFDALELLVVDHPAGTEVWVDERFAGPPVSLATRVTGPLHPVAQALDHRGRDVSELVRSVDERYLDTFELGPYQGVAEPHWVELELPDALPRGVPLALVAHGWLWPTDSSINLALGQSGHGQPEPMSIEVPDGEGGWRVARAGLGFPAGKLKTVVLDLDPAWWPPKMPRRLRLRTNLEVYWDAIAAARLRPSAPLRQQRLAASAAELRYRGFSSTRQAGRRTPELPVYDQIRTSTPQWLDLEGYYTAFGDVRELLASVDDRYAILNAGDELALAFDAPPEPPAGWTRDFVLIGDGWTKDGDFNTTHSATVLPLPSHADPDYAARPGRLEADAVYRRHEADWQRYHTRYVTARGVQSALSRP